MKVFAVILPLLTLVAPAHAADTNPIQKVIEMISDLQAKVIGEGTAAHKVFEEFSEFCEDRSKELHFEIKTEQDQVAELKAYIAEQTAIAGEFTAKIEELSGELATDEADLKAATEIRDMEQVEFAATEKELVSMVDTLGRAIDIIKREMAKGGASMLQMKNAATLADVFKVMMEASMISYTDGNKLAALVQTQQEESGVGAPDPAVYKSQSGDIVEALGGLFEKAEQQLAELRTQEAKDIHNFQMMKQGLQDEIAYGEKELAEAKTGLAEAEEKKANAQGELDVTSKDLAVDIKELADLHADCMAKATDFEEEMKSRGEELKALATAKKVIVEATSGAESLSYGLSQMSFLQTKVASRMQLANFEAVQWIKSLAQKHKDPALSLLASRMSSAMTAAVQNGDDPFVKVKGLIKDMIEKLEAEAEADATKKAWCDRENAESTEKKNAKEAEIEKLTTSIDSMSAKSAKLKEEVATLQKELADIAKAQAEMDKVREEEKAIFDTNKPQMEKGIKGIKLALKVLTEYYAKEGKAHGAADGAGAGIIGLLEVCESDFTKGLAEMVATEEAAVAEYESQTKENEIQTTTKKQDVKYKTQEYTSLDKAIKEATADRATVQEELDAVNEYLAELKKKCFPLPAETYEELVRRRTAEIEGLKKGLTILEGGAVLIQERSKHFLRK